MNDLRSLFRRSSSKSSITSASNALDDKRSKSRTSLLSKTRKSSLGTVTVYEEDEAPPRLPDIPSVAESQSAGRSPEQTPNTSLDTPDTTPLEKAGNPILSVQAPTPDLLTATAKVDVKYQPISYQQRPAPPVAAEADIDPLELPKRQSIERPTTASSTEQTESDRPRSRGSQSGYLGGTTRSNMSYRKIWVKRTGASATLVPIQEDDLVDDVRDRILKKYGNSLGRSFDAPDVTLRILPRDSPTLVRQPPQERTLGPEESMTSVLHNYFPRGQKVENALIIDVPRRTPRHSPRPAPYYMEDSSRPVESGSDYFPVMPVAQPSPRLPPNLSLSSGHAQPVHHAAPHSMSVINTGHVPPLPSPGGVRNARHNHRPRFPRTQSTTSPTVLNGAAASQLHDSQKSHLNGVPPAPPLPTPPLPTDVPHRTASPPPRTSSPRPKTAQKLSRKPKTNAPKLPTGLLDGAVPPINVLIVEDNVINLKLLEAFMKRLKVRWSTAMNGREAVNKWRDGGFHLVLMDIQLPIMNGLDATKAIRRLERLNNIGVFSSSAATTPTAFGNGIVGEGRESGEAEKVEAEDTLVNTGLFKSPVIIVALTASSLQSDRHEALAAGCNDFLTKPVSYIWLERKIMEWGCMQALIDFDGWRKWKDFSNPANGASSKTNTAHQNNAKTAPNLLKAAQKESAGIDTAASASKAANWKGGAMTDKRLSVAEGGSGSGTGSGSELESGDGGIVAGA